MVSFAAVLRLLLHGPQVGPVLVILEELSVVNDPIWIVFRLVNQVLSQHYCSFVAVVGKDIFLIGYLLLYLPKSGDINQIFDFGLSTADFDSF